MSSLSYLHPHLDAIQAKAEALDVPTPVVDALKDLFSELNTPRSSYRAIRPTEIIAVLTKQTEGRTNSLFNSREHQDAQELFQVITECIKNETLAVDKEGARDRGLGALAQAAETTKEIGKSPFDGLTANRRSCVICGYTEAVMHFSFDSWQLSVPRLANSCRLEDCLEDYTRLEILKDCICRKCSLVATHAKLVRELEGASSSKKRLKKMETRVKEALAQGRIEDDLKDVPIEKVFSPASTKQAMVARPPPVLVLHLNRSIHYGQYASKNTCRVVFPEVLDLTPYTTSGSLSTIPTAAISTPPPRATTPSPSLYGTPRTIYRLAAVVCHYGSHSFGHYICYRRKPRSGKFTPPKLSSSAGIDEDVFEDGETAVGKGWLRISDDSVRECGLETVLADGSGAFMLYYERAQRERPGLYGLDSSASGGSLETLKPKMKTLDLNGSVGSLVSEVGVGVAKSKATDITNPRGRVGLGLSASLSSSAGMGSGIYEPRVVRSVAAGRGRSASVQPSSRAGSVGSVGAASSSSLSLNHESAEPGPSSLSRQHQQANGSAVSEELEMKQLNTSTPSIADGASPSKGKNKKKKKKASTTASNDSTDHDLSQSQTAPPNPSSQLPSPSSPSSSLPPKTPLSPDPTILSPQPGHPPSSVDDLS